MEIPVTIGADIELGNAWTGADPPRSNLEAACRVLREVPKLPPFRGFLSNGPAASSAGEWGRHWLPNSGCLYCDMSHVEAAVPETASARDHAAAFHAMLRIVRAARRRAQHELPQGEELFVNAHVSDGTLETSWGAHLNLLVSRELWDDLFQEKPHKTALLASFIAAAMPVFGQGLLVPVGETVRYVTAARAHHIGHLVTLSTTESFGRGLLNSRDEAHAGPRLARLHLIAFDTNLQPATILMRTGLTQLVVAALAAGWFDAELLLDDPVAAVVAWSWGFDPQTGTLRPPAVRRPGGRSIGLFDWHRRLIEQLGQFVETGRIPEQVVPEGRSILELWAETLDDLVSGDVPRLAARLDWALKWQILSELPTCPNDLADPRLRLLDQFYSHVDDRVGLFWSFWREELIDRIIDDEAIRRFMSAGDPRTRSGLRGELVRRLRPWIVGMDWDHIELSQDGWSWWYGARRHRIELPDPSAPSEQIVRTLRDGFHNDEQLLNHLIRLSEEGDLRFDGDCLKPIRDGHSNSRTYSLSHRSN